MNKASQCPKCKELSLWHNEGISAKNNKPYSNNKCNKCGFLEWLSTDSNKPQNTPKTTDLASFMMNKGQTLEQRVEVSINETQTLIKDVRILIDLIKEQLSL